MKPARRPDFHAGEEVIISAYKPYSGASAVELRPPRPGRFVHYVSPAYDQALVAVEGVEAPVFVPVANIAHLPGTPLFHEAVVSDATGKLEIVIDAHGREVGDRLIVRFESHDDAMEFAVSALNVAMAQWRDAERRGR